MSSVSTTTPASASNAQVAALRTQLQGLAASGDADPRREITIDTGKYDFGGEEFPIRLRGVTIRANDAATVVLRNIELQIDLDSADDILIQDISFRSDGAFTTDGEPAPPRDAIKIESLGAMTPPNPDPRSSVRVTITHCAFNGYFDIAIDSSSATGRPPIVGMIDHCLFYDNNPGQPLKPVVRKLYAFANRGAINVSGDGANALYTIANNVFINVWRRSPRVADGNRVFVYNNLFFRWGTGNYESGEKRGVDEWFAIATDDTGKAVIRANRFIPDDRKTDARKTISIGNDTDVDLGSDAHIPDSRNRFDGSNGRSPSPPTFPLVSDRIRDIDVMQWYTSEGIVAPMPLSADAVDWPRVVLEAGPRHFDRVRVTNDLIAVITAIPIPAT